MPTLSADAETDFLVIYRQTIAGLPPRDRLALDHALRSVTTAFAVAKSPAVEQSYPDLPDLPGSHVAAIAESIADLDAGRVRDGDEILAELRERFRYNRSA